jgi:D-alanine-D-alanine ligase
VAKGVTADMHILWNDLPQYADFAFIALHGGVGENGSIQGALEMLGIPYNGSGVLTSSLCIDKHKTNRFLDAHGIATPQHLLLNRTDWHATRDISLPFNYPVILKPHDSGCSHSVTRAGDALTLYEAIDAYFENTDSDYVFIEELIQGMELTIGCIGNEKPCALPPSQALAQENILSIKEKFLPGGGENQTPAPLPEHITTWIQSEIETVYTHLNCKGYARIDCFYQSADMSPTDEDRLVIIEVNTLPGMTPATCIFHQAAEIGMRPMEFIETIITLGQKQHMRSWKQPDATNTAYETSVPKNQKQESSSL